ncbi:MAG: glycosyltransferase [Truepera sp.]|nr:glycosyltransferase [Truepera sp.]
MNGFLLGGAEKQLATLFSARPSFMNEVGVEIITFLPTQSDLIADWFAAMGVKSTLIDRQAMSFPSFFWKLVTTIRSIRPQIVHTLLDSSTGAWGRLAARLAGVPHIFHSDLSLREDGTRIHFLLRPWLDRLTRRFLPNAEATAERLVRSGVPREKIIVIPNGVDLAKFAPDTTPSPRAAWGIPASALVAGFLGRFHPIKRLDLLLDAVLQLPVSDRPDYLVLGGDGPTMPMVRERVASDPWLQNHCRLLGTVEDVPGFMTGVDYLVLCSDTEGLPNAVLEAMAMRRPVVATSVSDLPRLVSEIGFTAEPGNATSLALALRQMRHLPPEQRMAMGTKARERVLTHYDLNAISERFWRAHLEIVS